MTLNTSELPTGELPIDQPPKAPARKRISKKVIPVLPEAPLAAETTPVSTPDSEPVIIEATASVPTGQSENTQSHKKNRHKRQRNKKPNAPQYSEAQTAPPTPTQSSTLDINIVIRAALEHNNNPDLCWKVQAIYQCDKVHLHLVRKELSESQLEQFEDNRVTDAVMRGSRPPSADEHWKRLYRDEMKALQVALKGHTVWIADTLPERKHTLLWGEKTNRTNQVDKDSQEFFLKRETKKVGRNDQWRKKSPKNTSKFG